MLISPYALDDLSGPTGAGYDSGILDNLIPLRYPLFWQESCTLMASGSRTKKSLINQAESGVIYN